MKKGVYISYTQIITTNCYLTFLVVLALPVPPVIIRESIIGVLLIVVLALPVPPVIIRDYVSYCFIGNFFNNGEEISTKTSVIA